MKSPTTEVAENAARPSAAAKNQFHHEGHEEHEEVFINVFITLRGVRVLRGGLMLSCRGKLPHKGMEQNSLYIFHSYCSLFSASPACSAVKPCRCRLIRYFV